RNLRQACHLGGSPAPFARDHLVAARGRADDQGLDDAVLANRLSQFGQAIGLESAARLERVWVDVVDRDAQRCWKCSGLRGGRLWRQRAVAGEKDGETSTERFASAVGVAHWLRSPWQVGCSFRPLWNGGRR